MSINPISTEKASFTRSGQRKEEALKHLMDNALPRKARDPSFEEYLDLVGTKEAHPEATWRNISEQHLQLEPPKPDTDRLR